MDWPVVRFCFGWCASMLPPALLCGGWCYCYCCQCCSSWHSSGSKWILPQRTPGCRVPIGAASRCFVCLFSLNFWMPTCVPLHLSALQRNAMKKAWIVQQTVGNVLNVNPLFMGSGCSLVLLSWLPWLCFISPIGLDGFNCNPGYL